ncbi:MAG TPA: acyl-CoA dehydrogenase family protein [Chloroflexota bacterium]|nr:acyl-CoA dehydrogenase family protein [Chloroflexota bacterium]
MIASPATERPVFSLKSKPAILPSYEAALDKARQLAPTFKERVPETEKLRRLPDETAAELIESGLVHLILPKRFGGSELGLDALLDVTGILAEACPSTGWVHALWGAHMWLAAIYPPEIQEMMWQENPRSLLSSAVQIEGKAERVEGGWRWTGKGHYSSGINHCNWFCPALQVEMADGHMERRWLLVPISDVTILEDWRTIGLKGTGSNTVVAEDIFIPENYSVNIETSAQTPGAQMHGNPQYRAHSGCIFTPPLAATAVGAARGFLHEFFDRTSKRRLEAERASEMSGQLLRFARASADVDAARALLIENAHRFSHTPVDQMSEMDRVKCRRDQAYAATVSREAVNSLFEATSASALFEGSEIQRYWRDTNAAAAHAGLTWDNHGLAWGRASFGLPYTPGSF